MGYKNFLLRIFFSFLFLIIYTFLFFSHSDKIIYLVTLVYLIILTEIILFFNKSKKIIIFYLLFSYFFVFLYFNSNFNLYEFTAVILCISCFDTFCYLIGKSFGKNIIFKSISPKKTYEGLIGGIIITNLISLLIFLFMDLTRFNFSLHFIIFTNLIIFFSFIGDFVQSFFKRSNSLKDSSHFIPGHGGFFDRFDSFILVIIPLSIINLN